MMLRFSSAAPRADLGVGAGAEPAGQLLADVELELGVAHQQRLGVGVDGDELDALQPGVDHAVDGVDATPADADHLDHGQVALRAEGHWWVTPPSSAGPRGGLSRLTRVGGGTCVRPRRWREPQPQLEVYSYVNLRYGSRRYLSPRSRVNTGAPGTLTSMVLASRCGRARRGSARPRTSAPAALVSPSSGGGPADEAQPHRPVAADQHGGDVGAQRRRDIAPRRQPRSVHRRHRATRGRAAPAPGRPDVGTHGDQRREARARPTGPGRCASTSMPGDDGDGDPLGHGRR